MCQDCWQHDVTVTNPGEAQEIYVGAHVWQDRIYSWDSDECWAATRSDTTKHSIRCVESGKEEFFDADYGAGWLGPIRF